MDTEDLITALIQIANYQYFLIHGLQGSCFSFALWISEKFVGLSMRFPRICIPLWLCQNSDVEREKEQTYVENIQSNRPG